MMNCTNSTIEYTKLYDAAAANSTTWHANVCATSGCTNITWRYNEIYNHQVEGIMWISGGASNWYIYGNVWHDGMTGVSRVLEAQDGVEGPIYFYNNTISNVTMSVRTANNGTYAAGSQGRNNIYWLSSGPGLPSDDYDFSNGALSETHGIGGGPNPFVNYSGKDYHLTATIGAKAPRDKGVALGNPYDLDMDGHTRGADGTWDMGAYEYATSGIKMQNANCKTQNYPAQPGLINPIQAGDLVKFLSADINAKICDLQGKIISASNVGRAGCVYCSPTNSSGKSSS
jgi:hypothetical protein